MLRTKKKQLNLKPNRVLDKRSSRGMLFENEELRLRTIHINDEVEKGQGEVKKLRKENEYLKREIWSLRDECEKLEEVLKKIYNGSEIPDLSELPAYQPTTRKHSTASAFGMWSSRRLSGISTYSSYCDYEDDDDDKSQRDDDNNSRRHSTCNDSDNDHSTSGLYQSQQEQEHQQQQQQYQQYYEGGGAPAEEIVSVHVHYTDDGQQYMTEYDDEDDGGGELGQGQSPSQRQPKISIDSTNSLESGQLSMDMDMEQHIETDLENHSGEEGVDVHTIRYYNQALPLQPLHHHTWQLHSPELEAVTEESENNTANTNSNNTSITITPQDQNNDESNNGSFDTLENLDISNPNGLQSRAMSVNGDKDKSNTISPFFNPTIEITPASSTSTNSNSSVTSGKKVMSENMSNGDNNSMGSVNNGTVGGGEAEESNIISANATSGFSSGSATGSGMGKFVVTKSMEGTRAERDRDGNGLPIDLGCVTLIPKKYQVTSEIKINTTASDSDSASPSASTSVGQINTQTDHEVVINGPSTTNTTTRGEEGEAGEHNSNHHHHYHNNHNPNMLETQSGMKRKEEDGNLTDVENNLTSSSWDPLPFPPVFEKNPNVFFSTTLNNTSSSSRSIRLEEKRKNFGQFYRNSQKTSTLPIGKEKEILSDSENQIWTGNPGNLDGENNPSNISNSVASASGVRKKSLPLHQSEPSLTSIIDSNQLTNLRVASENNSCRCIHGFSGGGSGSGSCRRSISGELGFDGFDHTVEMCSLLSPPNPDDEILQVQDNENEQDPTECIPIVNSGFPVHGWNSVDRNVVIGYLDEEENGKDIQGFEDLSAQEVIDELEMQFDPTLERVAGVRMLTANVKIPRVFISLRTAVGVKTFIEKGFSLRSCPLKLMDASKKFALILLSGIPPAVPDASVISILNEFGQVVAPLERRTYKGVDISERIARMHLVRKMPGAGTTTLNIAGYPVLVKILQTNVSPGLSNPNTLSRPHSVNQQYSQPLHLSPMKTQELVTSNSNSLIPPCETHPSPSRYQSSNVMVQRQGQVSSQNQSQIPTSPRTAPIQPPSPGFIDFRRPSTIATPVTPSSPGGLRPHSPSPQIPAIPNSSINSKIPSPHRKLGKSISAAPGYLPGNPDDQQQQQQSQLHSLGPTALAINKRKMSVCSIEPGDVPVASSTPKTPTSPNTNPKAFLGNPKKPLARLSRNSLIPQNSTSSGGPNPNELSGGQEQQQQQQQQQSASGLGMIKPLLRSLSFEPRRISSVSAHHQHNNNNNNNNNNISNKVPNHGSQVSLAESQQYQPFQGQGSRGSILMHSNSGSGRSQPKYYQPHGQLTNNNSNSSNFRNMDKKSSESALPWFGCC